MKLLKITKAEFRKIILRPSVILILIAIFALSIINILTFAPSPRNGTLTIYAATPSDLYNKYVAETEVYSKGFINNSLTASGDSVRDYASPNSDYDDFILEYNSAKSDNADLITEINAYNDTNDNLDDIKTLTLAYKTTLTNLLASYKSKFSNNKRYLVSTKSYNDIVSTIEKQLGTLAPFNSVGNKTITDYQALRSNFELQNMFEELLPSLNKIKLLTFTLEEANTIITQSISAANVQLSTLDEEINEIYNNFVLSDATNTKNKMQALITQYYYVGQMAKAQIDLATKMQIGINTSDAKMRAYIGYESYNRMQIESIFTKYNYILSNGIFENDYLDLLNPGYESGTTTNAFDFAVYALQFSIILIIVFCLITLSKIISGEQTSGTIKLVAIRPYSRTKLILGKLFSVFSLGLFLYVIAVLFNLAIGIFMYGMPTTNSLITIFNGSKIILTSPICNLLLFAGSHLASLLMYVAIGTLVCVLMRSQTASTLISLGSFGLCILLNGVASKGLFYKLLPNANFTYYKLFGGTYFTSKLTSVVSGSLPVDISATYLVIYYIICFSIVCLSSIISFNKKDIA